MRKFALALAAGSALLIGTAATAGPKLTPQERLDKLIAGREAGKPVSCLNSWDTRDMTVLDKTALVYRSGNTIWVNRPDNARQLDDDDILVTKTTGSQLCKLDIVQTVDRTGGFWTGFVNLGDFVPYKKVAKAD
ncbi:hypothetical protein [Novosphingobium sp. B 225]|uniref:hypothetical protein n=1 Tax=Novosphingobium sp. B 225 TaxID=1961849 RepID=UPI000B4A642F|nr:hypothetical protein [Novosphingobium sp. B 225]